MSDDLEQIIRNFEIIIRHSNFIIHEKVWRWSNVWWFWTNFAKSSAMSDGLMVSHEHYRQLSNISRTSVGNKIVDHSDVVGTSPVGAAPTTSSFSTWHLATLDWAKTTARRDEEHLKFGDLVHLTLKILRYYVYSLWPSDVIWQHRSRSTLAQEMAWCLMVPSHCLKKCWLIKGVLWHSPHRNFTSAHELNPYHGIRNYTF